MRNYKYDEFEQMSTDWGRRDSCNHAALSITSALIGAAIGATAALLLAPKSGDQLRGDILRGVDSARNRGERLFHSVRKVVPFRGGSAETAQS